MTAFVAIAVLLTCAVLLCLLPPLLRRDPDSLRRNHDQANLLVLRDQARELDADLAAGTISGDSHAAARQELAARVVEDVVPGAAPALPARHLAGALALALAVPLFTAALYLYVGNPSGVLVTPQAPAQHDSPDSIESMVATLAQRMQETPGDIEGLHMLARSYTALERHADAARTYARLAQLLPDDAGVLADYADALGTSQGASLKGEPERLIVRALAIDPKQLKALSLSGSAAFERGDFERARKQWQAVLEQVPADTPFARSTSASIAAAAQSLGEGAAPEKAAPSGALAGTVRLAPALRAGLAPTDTVFIYARAVNGKGPPLAAMRVQVRDLPLQFTLDDSMGVGAGPALSQHERVVVGARISSSGSATPSAGEPEGSTGPVASDARGIVIEINGLRK